jgi:hypothetical protein
LTRLIFALKAIGEMLVAGDLETRMGQLERNLALQEQHSSPNGVQHAKN